MGFELCFAVVGGGVECVLLEANEVRRGVLTKLFSQLLQAQIHDYAKQG
ncbi:MAG: hypothetical protein QME78_09290 [Thermodesulfobacteriota bacterium]|nr:hypothetical protein [Thermodesulfobacteriota bacterium]